MLVSPLDATSKQVSSKKRYLLGSYSGDSRNEERDDCEEVDLRPRMVLHQSGVSELDADRVVHSDEDEEQGVCHEVLLAVVTQKLIVLARLIIHLDGCHVNGLVADESNGEPDSSPEPVA